MVRTTGLHVKHHTFDQMGCTRASESTSTAASDAAESLTSGRLECPMQLHTAATLKRNPVARDGQGTAKERTATRH